MINNIYFFCLLNTFVILVVLYLSLSLRFSWRLTSWSLTFLMNPYRFLFWLQIIFYLLFLLTVFIVKLIEIDIVASNFFLEALLHLQFEKKNVLISELLSERESLKTILSELNKERLMQENAVLLDKELSFSLFDKPLENLLQLEHVLREKTNPLFCFSGGEQAHSETDFPKETGTGTGEERANLPEEKGYNPSSPLEPKKSDSKAPSFASESEQKRLFGSKTIQTLANEWLNKRALSEIEKVRNSDDNKALDIAKSVLTTIPGSTLPRDDVNHSDFIRQSALGDQFAYPSTNDNINPIAYQVGSIPVDAIMQETLSKANLTVNEGDFVRAQCINAHNVLSSYQETLRLHNKDALSATEHFLTKSALTWRGIPDEMHCVVYADKTIPALTSLSSTPTVKDYLGSEQEDCHWQPDSPTNRLTTTPGAD